MYVGQKFSKTGQSFWFTSDIHKNHQRHEESHFGLIWIRFPDNSRNRTISENRTLLETAKQIFNEQDRNHYSQKRFLWKSRKICSGFRNGLILRSSWLLKTVYCSDIVKKMHKVWTSNDNETTAMRLCLSRRSRKITMIKQKLSQILHDGF